MEKTIILEGIVGSHAYGLNTPTSDIDTLSTHVDPTISFGLLEWNPSHETYTTASPVGDDSTSHEIRKYVKLLLKSNPTALELLWLDSYQTMTIEGSYLLTIRDIFPSQTLVKNAYIGYARHQLAKFQNNNFKSKHAKHVMRLLDQGSTFYHEGILQLKVSDPSAYHAFDDLAAGAILDILAKKFLEFDETTRPSPLRELPDYDAAKAFIYEIRSLH